MKKKVRKKGVLKPQSPAVMCLVQPDVCPRIGSADSLFAVAGRLDGVSGKGARFFVGFPLPCSAKTEVVRSTPSLVNVHFNMLPSACNRQSLIPVGFSTEIV
jgi:hypothetical protein